MSFVKDSQREIFGISGISPEILAVGFAKYSRSQDPIKVTLGSITKESSSKFHNKWVLGYGDASVADMAMVSISFENVSILASKEIEDTRIASFQEKSTRYVPFYSVYIPSEISDEESEIYKNTVDHLMASYNKVKEEMITYYSKIYPKPEEMSEKLYKARLQARALDIARYLLPTGTVTNFGMIASARSIRYLVSKLKVSKLQEVRQIAVELEKAATEKGYSPYDSLEMSDESRELLGALKETAPTLVKHTEPRIYLTKLEEAVKKFVVDNELFKEGNPFSKLKIDIEFLPEETNLDPVLDVISCLVYKYSGVSISRFYGIKRRLEALERTKLVEFLKSVNELRGKYDQPDRAFEVNSGYIFDTCMDYGAYRDLQRHRMCTQISMPLDTELGYSTPRDISNTTEGIKTYNETMDFAKEVIDKLPKEIGTYLIPLGFNKRTLFKMNLRELIHIVNLRTKTGGHFSYRNICYKMYHEFVLKHPELDCLFDAVKMDFEADFFKR